MLSPLAVLDTTNPDWLTARTTEQPMRYVLSGQMQPIVEPRLFRLLRPMTRSKGAGQFIAATVISVVMSEHNPSVMQAL